MSDSEILTIGFEKIIWRVNKAYFASGLAVKE